MNKVNLIGRTTKDMEIKMTEKGLKIAKFAIAVNKFGNREVDFINCVAFNKVADILESYVKKGNQVGISGRMEVNNFQNKDGKMMYNTVVNINEVFLLQNDQPYVKKEKEANTIDELVGDDEGFDVTDEDLPF